jgi:hypothetical protein
MGRVGFTLELFELIIWPYMAFEVKHHIMKNGVFIMLSFIQNLVMIKWSPGITESRSFLVIYRRTYILNNIF